MSTAPLRKLERKAETIQHLDCQPENNNKDTNLGICDVIGEYGKSASGDLCKRRVAKAELLDQESVVTEQVGCALCARKRSDWICLSIVGVMLWIDRLRTGWTNRVSDNKDWDLELRRGVWREFFNGTNRPSIRSVAKTTVRTHPQKSRFCTYPSDQRVPT